jgi:hypothetical protein
MVFAAATIAAFLERWWFGRAWGEQASLTSVFYYGDAPRLTSYAIAILKGQSFDNGIPFHPPGWPLVLALFLRGSGAVHGGDVVVPVAAVRMFLAAISALAVGTTTLVAYEIAGIGAMLAVSVLGAFHFGHIVEGTVPNSEALYSLGIAVFMWTSRRWLADDQGFERTHGYNGWAALTGVVAGSAMLVRAEFLACVVVIAAADWWRRGRTIRALAGLGSFFAAFVLVLLPATVWHWKTLSAFNASHAGRVAGPLPTLAPVTSYGPFNFAMANHSEADGGPNRDHPMLDQCNQETDVMLAAGELDLACPQVYDLYVHGYRIGGLWLIAHPDEAIGLMGRKIGYMIGFLAQGYLFDDIVAGVSGVRRRVDMLDPDNYALVALHLLLIAVGVVVLRKQPVVLWVLAAPIAGLVGATLLFYGYERLGVVYLPPVWVAEGVGIAAIGRRVGRNVLSARSAVAVVLATMALVLSLEFARRDDLRTVTLDGPRTATGVLVDDETVRVERVR